MHVTGIGFERRSDRTSYAQLLRFSDERLIRELQAGNTDAFAVIFKRYHRLIHVTALNILRDAAEAEDVTQVVFLEIYRKVEQFDSARGSLKVWLLQYAYSRSMNRRNYLLVRQVHGARERTAMEEEGIWSPSRLPLQETAQLTNEALATLPEAHKRTIEMFFFEGLTLREIAERQNESLSNVRHQYYRGLERLRATLESRGRRVDGKPPVVPLGVTQRVGT